MQVSLADYDEKKEKGFSGFKYIGNNYYVVFDWKREKDSLVPIPFVCTLQDLEGIKKNMKLELQGITSLLNDMYEYHVTTQEVKEKE